MKRIWFFVISFISATTLAYAGTGVATLLATTAISTNDTKYSATISSNNVDTAQPIALLVDIGTGGGAAGVTVSQQCSLDGTTWYNPVNQANVAVGTTGPAITADKYVTFTPVAAPKTRFKIVVGATVDTVSLKYIWKE